MPILGLSGGLQLLRYASEYSGVYYAAQPLEDMEDKRRKKQKKYMKAYMT